MYGLHNSIHLNCLFLFIKSFHFIYYLSTLGVLYYNFLLNKSNRDIIENEFVINIYLNKLHDLKIKRIKYGSIKSSLRFSLKIKS